MSRSTAKLVQRARQGDQHAFGRLVEAHYCGVHAILTARTGDLSVAEDLAQETFLTAWTHLDQLRNDDAFPQWARQIARNLSASYWRSEQYRARVAEHYGRHADDAATPTPEDAMTRSEKESEVWEAIQTLRPNLREAVIAFYWHGQSIRETAAALDITPSAAKKRLQYAREKLRGHFEAEWESALGARAQAVDEKRASGRALGLIALGPAAPEVATAAATKAAGAGMMVMAGGAQVVPFAGAGKVIAAVVVLVAISSSAWFVLPSLFVSSDIEAHPASGLGPATDSAGPTVDSVADEPAAPQVANETTPETLAAVVVADENEDVTAPISGRVMGRVKMSVTEESVAGAKVMAHRVGPDTGLPDGESYSQATDDNGRYKFQELPPGDYLVYVRTNRASPRQLKKVTVNENEATIAHVELEDYSPLFGQLLSENGEPVPNALMTVGAVATGSGSGHGPFSYEGAITDRHGMFVFSRYRGPGHLILLAQSATHGNEVFLDMPFPSEGIVPLRMGSKAVLSGRVIDHDDQAIGHVKVVAVGTAVTEWIEADDLTRATYTGLEHETTTDDNGNYLFDDLDPDVGYSVQVYDKDDVALTQPIPVPKVIANRRAVRDIKLYERFTVQGTVVGSVTGRPLRDIKVAWEHLDSGQEGPQIEPGPDGRFEIDVLSGPGLYRFCMRTLYGTLGRTQELDCVEEFVAQGEEHLRIVLTEPVTLSVRAKSQEGDLEDVRIRYRYGTFTGGGTRLGERQPEAYFEFSGFEPWRPVGFQIAAPGYLEYNLPLRDAPPGYVWPTETVWLHRRAEAVGRLVGGDKRVSSVHAFVTVDGQTYKVWAGGRDATRNIRFYDGLPAGEADLHMFGELKFPDGGSDVYYAHLPSVYLPAGEMTDLGEIVLEQVDPATYESFRERYP